MLFDNPKVRSKDNFRDGVKKPDYENFKNREVKVIILDNSIENTILIKKDDFIAQLISKPKHILSDVNFLSRDEANGR